MYAKKGSTRKVILTLVLLALVVGGAIGGTFAWLIAQSNTVSNTFTEGNVNISLNEHLLDPQTGAQMGQNEWVEVKDGSVFQEVELLPGRTIYKDPTVFVEPGSEACYVRMYMIVDYTTDVENAETVGFDELENWFGYNNAWELTDPCIDTKANQCGHVYEFTYKEKVPAVEGDTARQLPPLFNYIKIDEDVTGDDFVCLKDVELTFIAQAVQARDGMENNPFDGILVPNLSLDLKEGTTLTLQALMDRNRA